MRSHGTRLVHKTTRGRVRRWRQHKLQALATSQAYAALASDTHVRRAERIQECANRLDFTRHGAELRLRSTFSCRNRWCPVCMASKARKDYAVLAARVAIHAERYPRSLPAMLTLTVPNLPTAELRAGIDVLVQAFRKLTRMPRVKRAVIGWHRSLEITLKNNGAEAHPHLHVLVFFQPGYFTNSEIYLSQAEWTQLWETATGRAGLIVHIKKLGRDCDGQLVLANDGLFELVKYVVKLDGLLTETGHDAWNLDPELLKTLHDACNRRRLRDVGGTLRKIKAPEPPTRPTDAELEAAHTEIESYLFSDWIDADGEIHGPDYWQLCQAEAEQAHPLLPLTPTLAENDH